MQTKINASMKIQDRRNPTKRVDKQTGKKQALQTQQNGRNYYKPFCNNAEVYWSQFSNQKDRD
jgi:hypothetical protein